MGNAKHILGLLVATSTSVICSSAKAERYMVKMRSPNTFKSEVDALKKSIVSGGWSNPSTSLFGNQVRYVDALSQGNVLIVDTQDKVAMDGLRFNPQVEYVEQERWIKLPDMHLSGQAATTQNQNTQEQIPWGIVAVGAPTAWGLATQGSRGQGTRVAVIDSGIDRSHVDLADRFEKGEDFINSAGAPQPGDDQKNLFSNMFSSPLDDVLAPPANENLPYPYFDVMGHGTHVSGTIAASQNGEGVVGVAPEARILAGRVCSTQGCSTVSIVRAIDWAISEKVDVINMSLGGPFPSQAQFEATQRAEAAGIVVVAAAGNDGSDHLGFPGGYPTVVSVAAVTPKLKRATFSQHGEGLSVSAPGTEVYSSIPQGTGRAGNVHLNLNGEDAQVESNLFKGSSVTNGVITSDLVYAKLGAPEDIAALAPDALKGKFALIQRGGIPFAQKVQNALAAGATGVIFYNNAPGIVSGVVNQDGSDIGIPVFMIEQSVGEAIVAKLSAGDTERASLEVSATDYASYQGTSMASPHVTGVTLLIKAANKQLTPDQIRSILKFTAKKASYMNEFEYGAGVVDAGKAIEFIESTRKYNWDSNKGNNKQPLPERPVLASFSVQK